MQTVRKQLEEALERIMQLPATDSLEACAYQGPPPKKWMREVAPALDARANAVREAQAIAKPALDRARAEPEGCICDTCPVCAVSVRGCPCHQEGTEAQREPAGRGTA